MDSYLISIVDEALPDLLSKIVYDKFDVSLTMAESLVEKRVLPHLVRFKDSVKLIIETDYVDKVYRDSYYHYYASKLNVYKRDCIKLSLFNDEGNRITNDAFKNKETQKMLVEYYMGFIVLRPTMPYIIGRSAISPHVLKDNAFKSCVVYIPSTAKGLKFNVQAFPYSSQDTETISCAETMIWAMMEYYGNKYPEYSPLLPSKILKTLSPNVVERQLPSSGLPVENMSFMLKECGLGPKLYSKEEFGENFEALLSCYVESGIPLIVALDNREHLKENEANKFIGHAVLCVGRELVTEAMKSGIPFQQRKTTNGNTINIKNWDDIRKKFVFIDDNHPVYQKEYLDTPTGRYGEDEDWKWCKITHFITPLYKKIYLEAYVVKRIVEELLLSDLFSFKEGKELYIRTFLCSARSYRKYVMQGDMSDWLKDTIIQKNTPKFIWVTEISDPTLVNKTQATGVIILDATESNAFDYKSLILALCNGRLVKYDERARCLSSFQKTQTPFSMFRSNIKEL